MSRPIKHRGWRWEEVIDPEPWQTPDPHVMKLLYELGKDLSKRVYDLGCGLGRHTVYFASHGYQVYSSDISAESINQTKLWLEKENLTAELHQGHFLDVDFPANFFDLVVSMNVLNHGVKSEVYQIIQKVLIMLKPGGHFEGTLRIKDKKTPFYSGDIEVLDEQTLIMTKGEERGIPHFFAYLDEIPHIFQGFDIDDGSFVYVKLLRLPINAENIANQPGSEILRFSVKKPAASPE